jgi:hypothetical protein
MHGCEARHVVLVRETFQGKVVWAGEVQAFDVTGHPSARRCYAWSHATGGTRRRFVVVLHAPPVDSPVSAGWASIVADAKKGEAGRFRPAHYRATVSSKRIGFR